MDYPDAEDNDAPNCLTILARPAEQTATFGWGAYMSYGGGLSRSLLYVADKEQNLFGLASIPLQVSRECEAIAVGPSGRGVWLEDRTLRQCSPKAAITGGGLFTTVDCDDYSRPLTSLPPPPKSPVTTTIPSAASPAIQLDIDDGMGRIAVACDSQVYIVDLV